MEEAGFLNVYEHRQQKKPWLKAHYHDVTLLAMEEMSLKVPTLNIPNPTNTRQIVQRAAQEFEDHHRGITLISEGVTVLGQC